MRDFSGAIFIFSILIVFSFPSCNSYTPGQTENKLARVDDRFITLSDARKEIPEYLLHQDSSYALQKYREDWIKQQLLLKEANRLNLAEKPEVKERLTKARNQVLIQALKDHIVSLNQNDTDISDEEARAFYQANKSQFALDEEFVRFRHLRARNNADARSAKQELLGGVSWETVAQKYAISPQTALQESDQFWPVSMAVQNINIMNRYLKIIGQNEISPIQRVEGEYHFVQLLERRAKGEQPDLSWLIEEIKDWMVLNKNDRNFSSYVKNLYLEAKSNNEIDIFNVTFSKSNSQNTLSDTLEPNSTDD